MQNLEEKTEKDSEDEYSGGGQVFIPTKGYQSEEGTLKKFIEYLLEKKDKLFNLYHSH